MERMMPIDLENAKLKKSFRGYDREQVRDMLNRAASEMETLRTEISNAQSIMERQKNEIDGYRAQENTLKEALILAQRTADETRASAHREADVLIAEAERKAREVEQGAQDKISDLRWEIERMRLEKQKFVHSFRALLESHLRDLAEQTGLAVVEGSAISTAEDVTTA